MHKPLNIVGYTLSCACGAGIDAIQSSILECKKTLSTAHLHGFELPTWVGMVPGADKHQLAADKKSFNSRNNRLLDYALEQDGFTRQVNTVVEQFGPTRVAVIMGSSTASMAESENTFSKSVQNHSTKSSVQSSVHLPHAPGHFVAHKLGIHGPAVTVSTACSSSAKAFALASRWIHAQLIDAVVVGGSDSLSLGTLYGFESLKLLSKNTCKPFDLYRDGINVGEAAGFALLTRENESANVGTTELSFAGYGESSDAHHMSHPHPDGAGAISAMNKALQCAQCNPDDIGYINLHGTATPVNDAIETLAISKVFKTNTLASSTKGWTGHTLGAAGITGAVFALEALRTKLVPGTINLEHPDESLVFPVLSTNQRASLDYAMINTFGFGGSNCSLVFGRQ